MEHSKRLVCGAQMDVLTTQANSYFVGVQMSKVLQRETFNLYRSFKLKKIPFVRASTPEIEYLIEVGAVPGSTHSITLVPVDLAIPYIQEVLKQQETGKGLTGRKPKRLREQQNNLMNHSMMRREDSEEDMLDSMSPATEAKRMRRDNGDFSSSSLSPQPSSPQATASHPDSPSSPFVASMSTSPSTPPTASLFPSTSSHSLFVPSFPLSTSLEASSSPALISRGGTQSASRVPSTFQPAALSSSPEPFVFTASAPSSIAQSDALSQSPPSSPTLLSLLSVGMEIDKARTRRRKPAPEAIYRSLKKESFSIQPPIVSVHAC